MEKVWICDPHEGFVLGRIVDLTEDGAMVARLDKSRKEESVSFDRLYSAESDDQAGYFWQVQKNIIHMNDFNGNLSEII